MKKPLIASYMHGITDFSHGESYYRIVRYFVPEFISALVLYSLLYLLDAQWVAHLKSTSTYATLGITNTLLHFIVKIGEGVSVGTIVVGGRYNGEKEFHNVGRTLITSFWTTCISGGAIAVFLFLGAHWIYQWYGVPEKMISLGVPFLRLRALGIFFTFLYFAVVGFMRSVKNTRTPMQIYLVGAALFLFFDYALIFGKFGFPEMQLQGSALATVIQYGAMLILAVGYVVLSKNNQRYQIQLFSTFASWHRIKNLVQVSWPVVLDKATLAAAYIWLGAMIAPMGKYALASFTVIKDMERLAILPAVAFAQIITFLVSNDLGGKQWSGIKSNIKKIVFLSSLMVFSILLVFSLCPGYFIQFFDQRGAFTDFSAAVFPVLSVLVFFDLLQLILSGALRGAGDVRIVMMTRLLVCVAYFGPISYLIAQLSIADPILKFILVYSAFYLGSGIMSIVYIHRFRRELWRDNAAL